MECVYINLDDQLDRRVLLERNFLAHRSGPWRLRRHVATRADEIISAGLPGSIRPAEKACFVSHANVLRASLSDNRPILVLEDDAVFGPRTCSVIDQAIADLHQVDWDVIFTDICASDLLLMAKLFRYRQTWDDHKTIKLLDLKNVEYSGSTAYIVNGRSKEKLLALLESESQMNLPYDLMLRKLVMTGRISGYFVFPFATTLSEHADESTIQPNMPRSKASVWNAFRRMVWIHRDLGASGAEMTRIEAAMGTDNSRIFGSVVSSLILQPE